MYRSLVRYVVIMIYYIALLDKEYNNIWHYLNPKIPPLLYGRLDTIGFDSLVSMLSAFSMLGAELFKEPLTSIEYNTFKISYYRVPIDNNERILSVIVTDKNEDLNKIKNLIEKLVKMHSNLIRKRKVTTFDKESYDNETKILLESFKLLQEKTTIGRFRKFIYRYRTTIFSSLTAFMIAIAALSIYYQGLSIIVLSTSIALIVLIQLANILLKKGIKRGKYYRLVS